MNLWTLSVVTVERMPVSAVGVIMWWTRRKPGQVAAPCRDGAGRKREILVFPTNDHRVALAFPSGEVAVLEPLQAGRVRGALRDVVFALGDAAALDQHSMPSRRWEHAAPTRSANHEHDARAHSRPTKPTPPCRWFRPLPDVDDDGELAYHATWHAPAPCAGT